MIRSVSEIGSGLDGHRSEVLRLLADPAVRTIVVEHRDRLARFGCEYIEAALVACGRKLVVVDQSERIDDLVPDMVDVFRRQDRLRSVLDQAVAVGAKSIWLQQGLWDEQLALDAEAAGMRVVMDRCLKVEHARLL